MVRNYCIKCADNALSLAPRFLDLSKHTTWLNLWNNLHEDSYSNADYVRNLVNRKSTSDIIQYLGTTLVSWSSKKQNTVALSTAEAEYVVDATCCSQVLWIKQQVRDFGNKFKCVPIYCDNTSAICISNDPFHHTRVKHIYIRYHFPEDNVEKDLVKVEFCPTENQIAGILTKPLPREKFEKIRLELGMIIIHKVCYFKLNP